MLLIVKCIKVIYYYYNKIIRDASDDEIKKSYRLLARKYHPDKSK